MLENNGHDSAFVEKSKTTFELLQTMFMGEMKSIQNKSEMIMSKLAETEVIESNTLAYISILNVAGLCVGGILLCSLWIMFFTARVRSDVGKCVYI
jgi:Mg2+/Co2+ transporter CorC